MQIDTVHVQRVLNSLSPVDAEDFWSWLMMLKFNAQEWDSLARFAGTDTDKAQTYYVEAHYRLVDEGLTFPFKMTGLPERPAVLPE